MSARAGANENLTRLSFDDNETTEWTSNGQLATAWIEYKFDGPASVGQVTLKLSGWRTQSYPVRISVDNKVVFEGNTPRSLGYVTFSFEPTTGKSLRLELLSGSTNKDAFGNIIEIPGTPDAQSMADGGGPKNTLSIIEIEIYEPLMSNERHSP